METQLSLLKKVQDIDIEISSIAAEEKRYNSDRERLSTEVTECEDKLATIKQELEELEKTELTLKDEAAAAADRIKKNEDRLKNIKNDKEFKAATKEMNAAKKEKSAKEEEINKLQEKIDEKKNQAKEQEDKLKNKQGELEAKTSYIETNKEKWEKEVKDKKEEKAQIAKNITASFFKKYETIREKRSGIAIAPAVDGICQGCHMNIPPQAYIQLQKGSSSELIFCPHCHRILYWKPAPKAN